MGEERRVIALAGDGAGELEEKKSRFLGLAHTVSTEEEAMAFLSDVRKANPGARHIVWAYLLRSGAMRCSDDGEPQGTGGVPLLEILRKSGVTDAMLTVTRYFGGILLGTGGLSRAYAGAAKLAFDDAGTKELISLTDLSLSCRYDEYQKLRVLLPKFAAEETAVEFADAVHLTLVCPTASVPALTARLTELTAGRLTPRVLSERMG